MAAVARNDGFDCELLIGIPEANVFLNNKFALPLLEYIYLRPCSRLERANLVEGIAISSLQLPYHKKKEKKKKNEEVHEARRLGESFARTKYPYSANYRDKMVNGSLCTCRCTLRRKRSRSISTKFAMQLSGFGSNVGSRKE